VAFGTFGPVDRDALPLEGLDLLARVEMQNTMLICRGKDYEERKVELLAFVAIWRAKRSARLAGSEQRAPALVDAA
jgi:hypothetical protein